MDKAKLRRHIHQLKKQYSSEDLRNKSLKVIEQIELSSSFIKAETIMCYWSMTDEVFTHNFLVKWYDKKTLLLPVIKDNLLIIKQFKGEKLMNPDSRFGILEPIGKEFTNTDEINLILVPGVAFDKNKNRLGRGKAFYDKFLPKLICPKIGICFDFQLIDKVPIDKYDIPMDFVISENFSLA